MSVDLSKCKIGDTMVLRNGANAKIARCSDNICRLLDDSTPFGFKEQDIIGPKDAVLSLKSKA